MLGIFGTKAGLIYDITLIFQIVILILLLVGIKYAKNKRLRSHGLITAAATGLHTVFILAVMVPSLIINFGILIEYPINLGIVITWIHIALGISVETLALFIVAKWGFRTSMVACAKRRKLMKPLWRLWLVTTALGVSFYVYYYII